LTDERRAVFIASVLGLFLELALIRWVSCEIRVFAYCKNLVLVASFLGFGAGCLLSRRPPDFPRALLLLLVLVLLVRLPWSALEEYGPRRVSVVLSELSGFMIFRSWDVALPWGIWARLAFAAAWTTLLFFLIALVMVPFGQVAAAALARFEDPLVGYSLNVAGSLAGILAYTLATTAWLPPLCWFVPAALGCLAVAPAPSRRAVLGLTVPLTLALLPTDSALYFEIWSSYQKLGVGGRRFVNVNNTGYQIVAPTQPTIRNRLEAPYRLRRPPGDVLVVGAGVGNDVAEALAAGARTVTAVEIDRAIQSLGRDLHPARPYQDPRVEVVIDDARHYLKTKRRRFDVAVFSHLDAHTVLSSFTSVRLDNYIYTVEAFREARARLAPGGILYVSYWSERPFIAQRLSRNLALAFDHDPVALEGTLPDEQSSGWRNVYFLTGEPGVMPALTAATLSWPGFARVQHAPVIPSTDAWPFLPLERRMVPPAILLVSGVILVLAFAFAAKARPRGEPFDGRVFWMGAAFLLLEVHNVSRLALVFGTTWRVNAWVIGAILSVILLANAVRRGQERRGRALGRGAAVGLFLSLAAAYLVPLDVLVASMPAWGGAAATVLMTTPIFFAGLLFADAFSRSASPAFALGWNVLGAVTGGMAENLAYVFGIPSLVLVAAAFYALAVAWPRRGSHLEALLSAPRAAAAGHP
jgi:SAM-dependent methyltransferase